MGYKMEMHESGRFIEKIGRDGREFAHVIENLRDALLAGAQHVWLSIYGPRYCADTECAHNSDTCAARDCVAKRVISDDGRGMPHSVLATSYSGFGLTDTTNDFTTDLDLATGEVKIGITSLSEEACKWHSRNGVGGRGALSHWNKLGVPTVTVHDGVALMTWSYRDGSNDMMMRTWIDDDGKRTHIIAPYTEPDVWTKDDLVEDLSFATMALFRDGQFATEDEARDHIAAMSETDELPNPLAGYAWDNGIVPKWIIHHYDETGIAYAPNGEKAHGTVKVLLGDHPKDHTGLIGDPSFTAEADFKKYNGVGNRFSIDLMGWKVYVHALTKAPRPERSTFTLHGVDGDYRYDSGSPNAHSFTDPTKQGRGRRQMGALALRTLATEQEERDARKVGLACAPSPVQIKVMLDLTADGLGKVLMVLRNGDKSFSGENIWGSSRKGVIVAVYRNEGHGLNSDDIDTADWQFRQMGIPTFPEMRGRVSAFWFPPLASDEVDGVYQTIARDRLRWKGRDDLPLTGDDGLNAAIQRALRDQHPEFMEAILAEMAAVTPPTVDMSKVRKLWAGRGELAAAAAKAIKDALGLGDETTQEDALIETDGGAHPGTVAGPHGRPGDNPRPDVVCDQGCTGKFHAVDCPNRSKGGGPGGEKGTEIKLIPDPAGKRRGRTSRARVTVPVPDPSGPKEPNPPVINWILESPDEERPLVPAVYTPSAELPDTGMLMVNETHELVRQLVNLAVSKSSGFDPAQVKVWTKSWVETELIKVVLGTLVLMGTRQIGTKESESYVQMGEHLSSNDVWIAVLGGLYFKDESLVSYVKAHATRVARPRRTSKAAAAAA